MTSTFKHWYDTYRDLGLPRNRAKRNAFVESTREDEMKQATDGVDYSEERVRLSIVHTRSDVALVCYELYSVNNTLRSLRRWLIAAVALIGVVILYLADQRL